MIEQSYTVVVDQKLGLNTKYRSIVISGEMTGRKVVLTLGYEEDHALDAIQMLTDVSGELVAPAVIEELYEAGDVSIQNYADMLDLAYDLDLTEDPDDE